MKKSTSTYLAITVFAILIITVVPLITIWSLNTLFSTEIPYNLATWAAAAYLGLLIGSRYPSRTK